jgi:hypothetical protein
VFISYGFVHYLVCRKGPFDTLMIFTTTIRVNNIYGTSNAIVPIIWLYMTVVVVIISFSKYLATIQQGNHPINDYLITDLTCHIT